ncbi:hypothetical protein M9H77_36150 [Catharanthus roseus]|uniref:Uncharacterized protein n=1 Tax=Catharanthus roseus TaxID=4058 RepID=A0ACB9ZRV0_CATRO|nr:hypothetical protein M9H77_36150 [Catharanthus roseus]
MVGEQPIRSRRSLILGHDDHTLSPLVRTRYSLPRSSSTATSSATPATPVIRPGEHNVEGKGSFGSDLEVVRESPGTGLSQGRKRTRVAIKRALSSKTSTKKARAVTPPTSAPLKAKSLSTNTFTQTLMN